MENEKYTARDFFTSIISNEAISEKDRAYAELALAKLDERNEKRKATPTKEQLANAEIKQAILTLLTTGEKVASEIGSKLDISTQKASSLCRQLVDEGKLEVADLKIKGKGTVKQYRLAE